MLTVELTKRLGDFSLDVAFAAEKEVTALFGKSGSGKSTLVHLIAGLQQADSGKIVLDDRVLFDKSTGVSLKPQARKVGVVFQEPRLFPHYTVERNLRYAARVGKRQVSAGAFDEIVKLLDIAPFLKRRPANLSGGEKQRVAIGRALLSDPSLLLLDEPMSALDETRKSEIFPYIERLRDETHMPIVYVSHAMDEVARLADQIVILDAGKVAAKGPVEDVFSRIDLGPLTGRHEAGSLLRGSVTGYDERYCVSEIDVDGQQLILAGEVGAIGSALRLRIRARDVAIATSKPEGISIRNVVSGTIADISVEDGPFAEIVVAIGNQKIRARLTRHSVDALDLTIGKPVYALFKSVTFDKRMVSGR